MPDPNATSPKLDSIAEQLAADGVAFTYEHPDNASLNDALVPALQHIPSDDGQRAGIIITDNGPHAVGELRNLAQDAKDATGFDTVVVRSFTQSAAVSDSIPRADLELGKKAMLDEPDFVVGVAAFGQAVSDPIEPLGSWGVFAGVLALVIACVVASTALTSRR